MGQSIKALELGRRVNKRKFLELCYDVSGEEDVIVSHWVFLYMSEEHNVLIDTGPYNEQFLNNNNRGSYIFYNDLENLVSQYVELSAIDIIILTHLHWDHCANSFMFPKARIFVQKSEVEYATTPIPVHKNFYDKDSLKFLKGNENIRYIEGDTKIDENLLVYKTPGHTPGSQSVLIIINGHRLTLQGDNVTLISMRPPGISTSTFDWWKSFERMKKLSDIVIPMHDPTAGYMIERTVKN